MTNYERLITLKSIYQLSHDDISKLLNVSKRTVQSWFSAPSCASHRNAPRYKVDFLETKLSIDGEHDFHNEVF